MRTWNALALVMTCGLIGAAAQAESVSVVADKDNTLYEFPSGDVSNGRGSYLFSGRTGQAEFGIRRALLAFDVESVVPAGSVITGVTLRMHMSKTPAGPSMQSLHRVMADWGEGASNDSGQEGNGTGAQAGDATWLHTFYSNSFWATPGGDFAATASAATSVGPVGFYEWSSPGMVSDVQMWLDDPDSSFGWAVLGDESISHTAKRYDSSEHGVAQNRPTLTINYVIPSPATMAPLCAGIVMLGARRRRISRSS